ncbi:MAG: DUF1553 domain-containing protein [Verrucomicrobia bacterium]|nr:DUF1553 domain-containing protein [Verrucomicrobiota bacterium]
MVLAAALASILIPFTISAANRGEGWNDGRIQFNRDVRPILSDKCFLCHGPDPGTRKAGLRLDREEGLFGERKEGTPVIKGKPDQSPLYTRLITKDEDDLMPPRKSHKILKPEEIELLKKWIEQGAPWQAHWSFIAPERPAVPEVQSSKLKVQNPIDNFIFARLAQSGLTPAPEADRRALIRRVSLDLTGLPPSPEEVEAFVKDKSRDAYEKLVDRLLASKRYGEHRARYWLDAARYADTHGLHFDNYREMWPYRDWVINAFNRNLPFSQFTIEQLAGDLLPNATQDQLIATGFHRCNMTTAEGGTIEAENLANYARDRVETTSWVWLGLMANCAVCHENKFDPISMKDFYSMSAFFRNTTQNHSDGNIADSAPVIVVPPEGEREKWFALKDESAALKVKMDARRKAAEPEFKKWAASPAARELNGPVTAEDELFAADLGEGKGTSVMAMVAGKCVQVAATNQFTWTEGPNKDKALKFGEKSFLTIPGAGDLDATKPFSVGGWVFVPGKEGSFTIAGTRDPKTGAGWSFEVNNRVPLFRLNGSEKGDRVDLRTPSAIRLQGGKWTHLLVTYDGSRNRSGLTLWVNGKPNYPSQSDSTALKSNIRGSGPLQLGGDGKRTFAGGALADFRIFNCELTASEVEIAQKWNALAAALAKPDGKLAAPQMEELRKLYLARFDVPSQKFVQQLVKVEAQQRDIRSRSAVTHVQNERMDAKPMAHILTRGQYDKPAEEVTPAVFASLNPMPKSAPPNRLGLAKWLVAADNPLVARVTVNRYWAELFGVGIVKTAEDFGIMGEPPSHQELLDWLAVEFRESGWDIKHMFRLMVTSAAYRQAAVVTPEKLEKDPANRLLSRGPRFRMDAEMVRDTALAASGLLSAKIGGPSVKPYQPDGVWEAIAMNVSNTREYKRDSGESLHRRSLYTFWKRQAPPALMDIFNAPSREVCTVRRERTDTPLQALATLNDPQFIEAGRILAEHALKAGAKPDAAIDFMSQRLLARPFRSEEMKVAKASLADLEKFYAAHPDDAKALLSVGEMKTDASLPAPKLAAWTMLANQLMNLDEVLNK